MFKRYFIHSAAAVLIGLPLAASAAPPVIVGYKTSITRWAVRLYTNTSPRDFN